MVVAWAGCRASKGAARHSGAGGLTGHGMRSFLLGDACRELPIRRGLPLQVLLARAKSLRCAMRASLVPPVRILPVSSHCRGELLGAIARGLGTLYEPLAYTDTPPVGLPVQAKWETGPPLFYTFYNKSRHRPLYR